MDLWVSNTIMLYHYVLGNWDGHHGWIRLVHPPMARSVCPACMFMTRSVSCYVDD